MDKFINALIIFNCVGLIVIFFIPLTFFRRNKETAQQPSTPENSQSDVLSDADGPVLHNEEGGKDETDAVSASGNGELPLATNADGEATKKSGANKPEQKASSAPAAPTKPPRRKRSIAATAGSWAVGLLGLGVLAFSIVTVPASHFGIVTLFGEVTDTVLSEGIHLVNPLARIHRITVGLDTVTTENAEAASRDLQTVHTSITVNFQVNPAEVRKLYIQNPNLQYQTQYIVPAVKEVLKAVTSHYTAEELITKRPQVSAQIRQQLDAKLASYHLIVQDINITNFDFSKTFNESIENKVKATQEAERAQRDLERIKFEAEQKIVTAKANAQSIRIQAEAIESKGGKSYVQLEAVKKWDGKLPTFTGNAAIPFVNVTTP